MNEETLGCMGRALGRAGKWRLGAKDESFRVLVLVNAFFNGGERFQNGSLEGRRTAPGVSVIVGRRRTVGVDMGLLGPEFSPKSSDTNRLESRATEASLGYRHEAAWPLGEWETVPGRQESGYPTIMGVCDLEKVPVTIGVCALEFLPLSGSPYMLSRNVVADKSWASEESEDCNELSRLESVAWAGIRIRVPIDRNKTSRVICVRPRCDRDPRIVWLYLSQPSA